MRKNILGDSSEKSFFLLKLKDSGYMIFANFISGPLFQKESLLPPLPDYIIWVYCGEIEGFLFITYRETGV